MQYADLSAKVTDQYAPALLLRSVFPRERREHLMRQLTGAVVALFALTVVCLAAGRMDGFPGTGLLAGAAYKVFGVFLVTLSVLFVVSVLNAFHRSYYFRALEHDIAEPGYPAPGVSWEVGALVARTQPGDATGGFLDEGYGQEVLFRAGMREESFEAFFEDHHAVPTKDLVFPDDQPITLPVYVAALLAADPALTTALARDDCTTEQCVEAARWVERIGEEERLAHRFWSRDSLGRIPGLGKTWGYGETTLLRRFGHDLAHDPVWDAARMTHRAEHDEVEDLERVLARGHQANALFVGSDLLGLRTKVAQLYHKVLAGHTLPLLESKQFFLVDLELLFTSTGGSKAAFETVVRGMLDQALHAGNTVVCIDRFPNALASAATVGTDLTDLLVPYLSSSGLQAVLLADERSFHNHLAEDARLMQTCDVVHMRHLSSGGTLDLLEQRAYRREEAVGVTCTIPALEAMVRLAERCFPTGSMPDKAFDLLEEVVAEAVGAGHEQVSTGDVEELVRAKTGVPVGTPTKEERDTLTGLEQLLHERVVGQDEAVSAIARAIRRARSGVGNSQKPVGTFLFLGPTGVGKTETAKALAEALFHDPGRMIRLDMSEYQGPEALEHLIGSPRTNEPGALAGSIEEQPYGVLLLDEFEKADQSVHDLFLQILDEGCYTDAAAGVVSARSLVIIATSNAGADLVWQTTEHGSTLSREALVEHLITTHAFRPELLNRFDDIVVFKPLNTAQADDVTRLQLLALKRRLHAEKGIELVVDEPLVRAVAQVGYDVKNGGRPLTRAIHDTVEQLVADRILADTLAPGDTLTVAPEDIARYGAREK